VLETSFMKQPAAGDSDDKLIKQLSKKWAFIVIGLVSFTALDYLVRKSIPSKETSVAQRQNYYQEGINANVSGDFEKSVRLLQQALDENPDDLVSRFALGLTYQNKGETKNAIREYERSALNALQTREKALFNMGVIHLQKKDYKTAESYYKKVIAANPNAGSTYYNLGFVYEALKDLPKAFDHFSRSYRLKHRPGASYYNAARISEAVGDIAKAIPLYRKSLEFSPGMLDATNALKRLSKK